MRLYLRDNKKAKVTRLKNQRARYMVQEASRKFVIVLYVYVMCEWVEILKLLCSFFKLRFLVMYIFRDDGEDN